MTIRIASFDLQNGFTRPFAMMDGAEGQRALDDHDLANAIAAKRVYSGSDKRTLLDLYRPSPFSALDPSANALVFLNRVRGDLLPRAHGTVSVTANGRSGFRLTGPVHHRRIRSHADDKHDRSCMAEPEFHFRTSDRSL
ncbi:hypothetical protein FXN65_14630 [Metapseudomonas lalkuanensis]|uniref:Uncharacterized protein n=1 Tax=Metapseudomonas lalkuanensis TaxID=2604832 RepID=A0A5J6QKE9_9GAMM|nr:hypothetical protein [Pseudomonas lalkuanensis]QEY63228.1 hypothetical protein FXN65_14630 [Pseudomonas lalkuanensis]